MFIDSIVTFDKSKVLVNIVVNSSLLMATSTVEEEVVVDCVEGFEVEEIEPLSLSIDTQIRGLKRFLKKIFCYN